MVAHRVDGRVIKFEGDPANPRNLGTLCPKGMAQIMPLYDPNRVKTPLVRTNAKGVSGQWRRGVVGRGARAHRPPDQGGASIGIPALVALAEGTVEVASTFYDEAFVESARRARSSVTARSAPTPATARWSTRSASKGVLEPRLPAHAVPPRLGLEHHRTPAATSSAGSPGPASSSRPGARDEDRRHRPAPPRGRAVRRRMAPDPPRDRPRARAGDDATCSSRAGRDRPRLPDASTRTPRTWWATTASSSAWTGTRRWSGTRRTGEPVPAGTPAWRAGARGDVRGRGTAR